MFGKKNLQIEKDRAWSKHGFYLCIPFDKFNTTYVYLYDYVCIYYTVRRKTQLKGTLKSEILELGS